MKLIKYGLYVLALYVVLSRPTLYRFHEGLIHIPPKHINAFISTPQHARIHGIDVSHYQGDIDFEKVEGTGLGFVYVKATEGITYVDPRYHENVKKLNNTKLLTGAYHFFQPDDDVIQQADNFIKQINNSKHVLPPMLDVEVSNGLNVKEMKARVKQWLNYVSGKLNCRPLLYSNGDFWKQYLGNGFDKYSFWLADYAKKPNLPAGLKKWRVWQYENTGYVNGIDGYVDHDVIIKGALDCHEQ